MPREPRDYWDPFEEMRRMLERFERMFEEPWMEFRIGPLSITKEKGRFMPTFPSEMEGFRKPVVDVMENEKEVIITVELPGIKKENIDVTVNENSVEIKAEYKEEEKEEGKEKEMFKRTYSGFYTTVPLPTEVKPDEAKATYNNGVLEIRIPKAKPESKGKKVKVE